MSLALAVSLVLASGGGDATDASSKPRSVDELTLRSDQMVRSGLRYLARQQNVDRSFSAEPNEAVAHAPIAVTALSTLAFMAGGSTMGRGPYQQHVRDGIEYLLGHTPEKPPPLPLKPGETMPRYFHVESDATSKMHGHGYATLAVAQAYGTMTLDPSIQLAEAKVQKDMHRMREILVGAVRLIEKSQSMEGGWYYDPYDVGNHEGSVTITMIQALRAARNVGVSVNKGVIDAAVKYIHDSQRTDGGFRYHLTSPSATYALTAAAIATLNATGDYDSDVIDRGMAFMQRHEPLTHPERWAENNNFPYYARLYAAQAYYMYRDPELWARWQELVIEDLENRQIKVTGAFRNEEYGKVYATAVSCLLLQLPDQYLPIFQK